MSTTITYQSQLAEIRTEMTERKDSHGFRLYGDFYFLDGKIYRLRGSKLFPADDIETEVPVSVIAGGGSKKIPFNSHYWDCEEEWIYLAAKEAVEPVELDLLSVPYTPPMKKVVVKMKFKTKGESQSTQLKLEV